jgi:hypothetical protein
MIKKERKRHSWVAFGSILWECLVIMALQCLGPDLKGDNYSSRIDENVELDALVRVVRRLSRRFAELQ